MNSSFFMGYVHCVASICLFFSCVTVDFLTPIGALCMTD